MNVAALRGKLRPHGIISIGCRMCPLFEHCGGIEPESAFFTCFDLCQDDCASCDSVCPRRADFSQRL